MPKIRSIILFLLVVAFLSCSQSVHVVEAGEQTFGIWRTGMTTSECILIQLQDPPSVH